MHSDTERSFDPNTYLNDLAKATEVLLTSCQFKIDDSVVDVATRLSDKESKRAAGTLLHFSQLSFSEDLREQALLAKDCRKVSDYRIGLLRGPLSVISIGKMQEQHPPALDAFYDEVLGLRSKLQELITST